MVGVNGDIEGLPTREGADLMKIFPGQSLGADYIKEQAIAEERYEILTELAYKFTAAIQLAREENE
ncbi:MAG: hypothetical protein WD469_11595 [Paenibacillaceae bacterium]